MKFLFTLLITSMLALSSNGQSFNYSFSNTTGTYTPLTGGTTVFSGGFTLAYNPVTVTIPAFKYYGFTYTQMTIFCNGFVQIGPAAYTDKDRIYPLGNNGVSSYAGPFDFMPMSIAPFAGYFASNNSASANVKWQIVGNEVIVQWHGLRFDGGNLAVDLQFQLRLNTSNNTIRFVYNNFASSFNSGMALFGQIGLRRSLATRDASIAAIKFSNPTAWGAWNNPVIHSNVNFADSGIAEIFSGTAGVRLPDNGRTYIFTPPADCSGAPSLAGASLFLPKGSVFCKGERGIVRLNGFPTSNYLRFRWETAPAGSSTFTPVSGLYMQNDTTFELLTDTLMADRQFRCVVTCMTSGQSATSAAVTLTTTNCRFDAAMSTTKSSPLISVAGSNNISSWKNGTDIDDNLSNAVPLGFNFPFKGQNYSNVYISTNGFITFDATATQADYGNYYPSTATNNNVKNFIAPFYANLTSVGLNNIYYRTSGTAPNRIFSIRWNAHQFAGINSTSLSFELHLYETTGQIKFYHDFMKFYDGGGINYNATGSGMAVYGVTTSSVSNDLFFTPSSRNKLNVCYAFEKNDSLIFQDYGFILRNGPECEREYTLTPAVSLGAGRGQEYPMLSTNHNTPATAITVMTSNSSSYCTNTKYRNTLGVSSTPGACATHQEGWFKFAPVSLSAVTTINVTGTINCNPSVSILDDNLTVLPGFSCVNATGEGATETINIPSNTLQAGRNYYIRVNAPSSFIGFMDYSYTVNISNAGSLPIKLLSFTAQMQNNNQALLQWKTEQAINFSHFVVEHSVDGNNWKSIVNVNYQALSSNYQFTHAQLVKGMHYYRLKQVDKDGKFEYSKIVQLESKTSLSMSVQPTLVNQQTFVQFNLDKATGIELKVVSITGAIVMTKKLQLDAGVQSIALDCAALADGTYVINAFGNKAFLGTTKFVKIK
jgi:hypothetical protein